MRAARAVTGPIVSSTLFAPSALARGLEPPAHHNRQCAAKHEEPSRGNQGKAAIGAMFGRSDAGFGKSNGDARRGYGWRDFADGNRMYLGEAGTGSVEGGYPELVGGARLRQVGLLRFRRHIEASDICADTVTVRRGAGIDSYLESVLVIGAIRPADFGIVLQGSARWYCRRHRTVRRRGYGGCRRGRWRLSAT